MCIADFGNPRKERRGVWQSAVCIPQTATKKICVQRGRLFTQYFVILYLLSTVNTGNVFCMYFVSGASQAVATASHYKQVLFLSYFFINFLTQI
jgi:hypothetical protein